MPRKAKNPDVDPAVQATNTTSRRGLIGIISAAVIAAVGTISAAEINNCGNIFKPGPSPSPTPIRFIGRVIDEKTEAKIRGAKVSLEGESVPPVAYSDSEGIFSFPVTDPNNEMRLRIEANQYVNYDLRTTPAKNQGIQDVRLTPKTDKTADLSGIVLDRNDEPIQGAKITIDDVPGMKAVEASSDGSFSLKDIPRKYGEMVRVRVVKEGYQPYTEDVVLGKTPPRIKLRKKR